MQVVQHKAPAAQPISLMEPAGQLFPKGVDVNLSLLGANIGYRIKNGWAANYMVLEDGRRQIIQIFVPGDLIQNGLGAPQGGLCLTALTELVVVPESLTTDAAVDGSGNVLPNSWLDALLRERAALVERVVSLGRRTARESIAQLLTELAMRVRPADWDQAADVRLELTQVLLSDMLGLSVVHVNRTLRDLRRDGLVETKHMGIIVRRPADLAKIAQLMPNAGSARQVHTVPRISPMFN